MKYYDAIFGSRDSSGGSDITITTTTTTTQPDFPTGLFIPILGVNGQINFNDHQVYYDNDDLCNVIASMGITGIRVPGGTVANDFHPLDPTNIPTPEMIGNLYAKTKANIFIVLNMLTSTLDEQIAWLRKLSSLFVPIKFIELGNEFPDSGAWLKKYKSADGFAAECRRWMAAIKQVMPNIFFGVPAGNSDSWNKKMMAIDPNIFLVWHYANSENYTSADGIVDVAKVGSLIDAERKDRFPGVPATRLWVTEYNLKIKNKTTDAQPFFKDAEQQGIAAACMMQKFYQIGCSVVYFHNVVKACEGGQCNGTIVSDAKGSYLSATGSAIKNFIATTK